MNMSFRLRRNSSPMICLANALVALLAVMAPASAHPAMGIAVDNKSGAVFYSDTAHVWTVARDASPRIVVRDVHTHELWIDADGTLYGEHLTYDAGRWSHRVWKRTAAGAISDVIAPRPGFLSNYRDFGFQRDKRGAFYWIEGSSPARLRFKLGASSPQTLAELPFTNQSWLTVRADGTVFASENGIAWRVSPDGKRERLPGALSQSRERMAIMGIAALADGTTYFAVYGDRAIRRLSAGDKVETIDASPTGWAPTGVAVAPDGTIWTLEVTPDNRQRARQVQPLKP
jgi:hypothetical protein